MSQGPPQGYPSQGTYPPPGHRPPPPARGSGATIAIVLGLVFGGVVVIGILAAVAIPAFMKYKRKARSPEATMNVRRLYEGARAYYEDAPTAGERQFPATPAVPTVPKLGVCCASRGGKCAPDPALWSDPSWVALRFSMDDPHYYSYTYTAEGTGALARFSAAANGDLDCDGVYSTFEMVGSIFPDGTVTGGAGLFRGLELE